LKENNADHMCSYLGVRTFGTKWCWRYASTSHTMIDISERLIIVKVFPKPSEQVM
jgi:hypothetical protein